MGDFTYTTVPGKIKPLLDKLRQVAIPPKASVVWLKSIGFRSSNDASLLGVLKTVGLVDASGVPTALWSSYRGANHQKILGEAIRGGYAELFAVYSDAWQRTNADLEHVFSTSSSAGKQVISKTVGTFKALCECAEFASGQAQGALVVQTGPIHAPVSAAPAAPRPLEPAVTPSPSVHIDIQIHISPEASPDQIDHIFSSMAKHLYGPKAAG